jgi:hypothetical protein
VCYCASSRRNTPRRVESEPDHLAAQAETETERSTASLPAISESGKPKEADKEETKWLYCSDDVVSQVSVSEVLKCKAYLLLYEQV